AELDADLAAGGLGAPEDAPAGGAGADARGSPGPLAGAGAEQAPWWPRPAALQIEELPPQALSFLSALMAGDGRLAATRDAVLALLMEGGGLARFQAAGLMEVHRDPLAQVPDGPHVRLALQYLYENAPGRGPSREAEESEEALAAAKAAATEAAHERLARPRGAAPAGPGLMEMD
ncbi:unnamed protein product, partial [Prorocentrum cordatum]